MREPLNHGKGLFPGVILESFHDNLNNKAGASQDAKESGGILLRYLKIYPYLHLHLNPVLSDRHEFYRAFLYKLH